MDDNALGADLIAAERVEGDYYFHPMPPPAEPSLLVICAGRERCLPGYRIDRPGFPFLGLEFVAAGRGRLKIGGRDHELGPGTLFVYGPGVAHRLETEQGDLTKYFVDFSGPGATQLLDELELAPGRVRSLGSLRWMRDIFDQLVACAELSTEQAGLLAPRLLELLLLRVREDSGTPEQAAGGSIRTYHRCRRFLRENYTRVATIEQAAAACHVNPAYFARLFRRYSSEPAYTFLVRLKMDHAADLLVRQGLTVQAVAARLGYDDPYHFSRVFKRHHHVSPKRFREQASAGAKNDS